MGMVRRFTLTSDQIGSVRSQSYECEKSLYFDILSRRIENERAIDGQPWPGASYVPRLIVTQQTVIKLAKSITDVKGIRRLLRLLTANLQWRHSCAGATISAAAYASSIIIMRRQRHRTHIHATATLWDRSDRWITKLPASVRK
jgi:hypothetical protein